MPFWLVFIVEMVSLFAETSWGAAFTGLFLFVGPGAVFLAWPLRRRQRAAKQRDTSLAARAEWENAAYLHGDPRGLFGQYPPKPLAGYRVHQCPRLPCQIAEMMYRTTATG
ncbi:hypothetical protein FXW78_51555 [Rhodococcus opacus]|nr:hypothetical protein [Rhodococcus opacus]